MLFGSPWNGPQQKTTNFKFQLSNLLSMKIIQIYISLLKVIHQWLFQKIATRLRFRFTHLNCQFYSTFEHLVDLEFQPTSLQYITMPSLFSSCVHSQILAENYISCSNLLFLHPAFRHFISDI